MAEDFIAPPFDTITAEKRKELEKKEANVIRLFSPENGEPRELIGKWIREGVLTSEKVPVLIVLEQQFQQSGIRKSRIGVIGLIDISDPSSAPIPHENTLREFVDMRKTTFIESQSQTEPVFVLATEEKLGTVLRNTIDGKEPDSSFSEPEGVTNNLYAIRDHKSTRIVSYLLKMSKGYVADGHHRLKALQELNEERRLNGQPPLPCLTYITPINEDSTEISGFHRAIRSTQTADFRAKMEKHFSVSKPGSADDSRCVRLYDGETSTLIPKSSFYEAMERLGITNPVSTDYLDSLIIGSETGRPANPDFEEICYTPYPDEAVSMVKSGNAEVAILMPNWTITEFKNVMEKRRILGPKSTFFYPKIPVGAVIYRME